MSKPIDTLDRFVASLTPAQRAFFLAREAEREKRYVALFAAASRVLNEASALVSDATHERLARDP
jgi:hypothetical protein